MTASYSLGHRTLIDIYSMFLGLYQAIHERNQGEKEQYLWRINLIEQKIEKIKGFGLFSIKEYFNYDPEEWISGLKDIISELRENKPCLDKKVEYINATLPEIRRLLPLPINL